MVKPGSTAKTISNRVSGSRLSVLRLTWWIIALLSLGVFALSIPVYYAELSQVCIRPPCLAMQLNIGRAIQLELGGLQFESYVIFISAVQISIFLLNLGIGVFLYQRKPDDWLAVMVSAMLITSLQADVVRALIMTDSWVVLPARLIGFIYTTLLIMIFYIFPTGKFTPRWTVLPAVFWIFAALLVPFTLNPGTLAQDWTDTTSLAAILGLVFTSLSVVIYRYKKVFNSHEKIQSRWVVSGLTVSLGGTILLILIRQLLPIVEENAFIFVFLNVLILIWTMILPLSIVVAILRSHIWDIDLIIRRTIYYTALTGTLLALYFGSVLVIKNLVESVTGELSLAISVVVTLVIAALFSPLRTRIQRYLDRFFYRQKYDQDKTLDRFRRSSRDEVDLDQITGNILSVVGETVQPETASLWLVKSSSSGQTGLFAPLSSHFETKISIHSANEKEDSRVT